VVWWFRDIECAVQMAIYANNIQEKRIKLWQKKTHTHTHIHKHIYIANLFLAYHETIISFSHVDSGVTD